MSPSTSPDRRSRPEEDHVPRRTLVLAATMAIVVGVVGVLVANAILGATRPAVAESPPTRAPSEIGIVEQTLVANTRRGLDVKTEQRESLDHFGWADRTHGVAQIPIERAMDLVTDLAFVGQAFGGDAGVTGDAGVGGGT